MRLGCPSSGNSLGSAWMRPFVRGRRVVTLALQDPWKGPIIRQLIVSKHEMNTKVPVTYWVEQEACGMSSDVDVVAHAAAEQQGKTSDIRTRYGPFAPTFVNGCMCQKCEIED